MEQLNQNQGHGIEPNVRETQQNTNKEHVTVLGLGPMGQALAGAFIKNGHATTVWNRTALRPTHLLHKVQCLLRLFRMPCLPASLLSSVYSIMMQSAPFSLMRLAH